MPGVSTQFHMLPEELLDFIADVMEKHSLGVELERWFPKVTLEVPPGGNVRKAARRFGLINRYWLLCKPKRSGKYEKFMLNAGEIRGNRLSQAFLGAGTDKPAAFAVLKKVNADLKKRTIGGIWGIGVAGIVGYCKTFRYSEGAAAAERSGKLVLQNLAFGQSFHVDPPAS